MPLSRCISTATVNAWGNAWGQRTVTAQFSRLSGISFVLGKACRGAADPEAKATRRLKEYVAALAVGEVYMLMLVESESQVVRTLRAHHNERM